MTALLLHQSTFLLTPRGSCRSTAVPTARTAGQSTSRCPPGLHRKPGCGNVAVTATHGSGWLAPGQAHRLERYVKNIHLVDNKCTIQERSPSPSRRGWRLPPPPTVVRIKLIMRLANLNVPYSEELISRPFMTNF